MRERCDERRRIVGRDQTRELVRGRVGFIELTGRDCDLDRGGPQLQATRYIARPGQRSFDRGRCGGGLAAPKSPKPNDRGWIRRPFSP